MKIVNIKENSELLSEYIKKLNKFEKLYCFELIKKDS